MKPKYLFFITILVCLNYFSFGQSKPLSSSSGKIFQYSDTIQLDSLTIIPGSVMVICNDSILPNSTYSVDYTSSKIIFKTKLQTEKVTIHYKTYPFNFYKKYYHKDPKLLKDSFPFQNPDYFFRPTKKTNTDFIGLSSFEKSGNITRGISSGNNQNLSVISDLNLQLKGKISSDILLTASITDNNIPIQPEGNTQQLQDFDQVFIQLTHPNFSVIAGDFVMNRQDRNFLRYSKKSQGALVEARFSESEKSKITAYTGAAIARGKYNRYKFQGIEGNQGPYKLQGANNERYLVVLSGTERVFMDGQLLTRGESEDYIINYNTAEIVFMPRVIVTKDKRFEVEFEYSEQNYSRAMLSGGISYERKNAALHFDFYSETDMKNQPIEPLSDEAKTILSVAGDNLTNAIIFSADSTGYNNDRIMYRLTDSLGYDSVLIFSTNPTTAIYQASFSFVGQGNGDYIIENTAANGKVYRWLAPQNGVRQGNYAPVRLLVPPTKKQVFTVGGNYRLTKNTEISTELALSMHDLNSFSALNSVDDQGVAAKLAITDKRPIFEKTKKWEITGKVGYQFLQDYFKPIERIRTIEFDRQWNGLSNQLGMDEHLMFAGLNLRNPKKNGFGYEIQNMWRNSENHGIQHQANGNLSNDKWNAQGNIVYSNIIFNAAFTSFLSHRAELQRNMKWASIGVREFSEQRILRDSSDNFLLPGSFHFSEYAAYIRSGDTNKLSFYGEYKYRIDRNTDSLRFRDETYSGDFIGGLDYRVSQNQSLKILVTRRQLRIADTTFSTIKPEKTTQLRFDYRLNAFRNSLRINSFYETNSGLEAKREYSYIEVAAGQGVYSWIDYNQNGIKELNEFEIAAFQDQANYLRILLPSSEYIKTYGSRFNLNLILNPARNWQNSESFILKSLSRFSNTLVFNALLKTTSEDIITRINPVVVDLNDSSLANVSSFFRNTMFFNRGNPKFSGEWNYNYTLNKMLMVNGYEGRRLQKNELRLRWNLSRNMMVEAEEQFGIKSAFSDYFESRDFLIDFQTTKGKISYQFNKYFRVISEYSYSTKRNKAGWIGEEAVGNQLSVSAKINSPERGSLTALASLIQWDYNAIAGNSIGFEMLEGFQTGRNYRWNLAYNRTLMSNLQLTVFYDGRASQGAKTVHTGSVQLRAYF